jgi:hypothetical protein
MPDLGRGSCDFLKSLIERFQEFCVKQAGVRPSMREISLAHLKEAGGPPGDEQRLARWTNPTKERSWRIPLRHVHGVVMALNGDERDVDELMFHRLSELGESHEAAVAANWGADYASRLVAPEEQRLLDLYREMQARYPYGVPEAAIAETLESVFAAHHALEEAALREGDPDAETLAIRKRIFDALAKKLAEQPPPASPASPPRGQRRTLTRRFLRQIQRRRP